MTVGEFRIKGELTDVLGLVDAPVTIRLEDGFVREVSGGAMAARLKKCFAMLPDAFHFAVELGHGLSDMRPTGIIGVDESIRGTCHVGIGDGSMYHLDLVIADPIIILT